MQYTAEFLVEKLEKHLKWVKGEEGGERLVVEASANLSSANLSYANLRSADLSYADLRYADLRYADLRYADLRYADLRYADLRYADLRSAKNFDPLTLAGFNFAVCPQEGAFVGFKKVRYTEGREKFDAILTLQIPAKAERISTYVSRKCRTNEAKVLRAETMEGEALKDIIFFSTHNSDFTYEIGKTVKEPAYNGNVHDECTYGIHFFITKKEAREY